MTTVTTQDLDYYQTVKYYYDEGYYTKADVALFVEKGKITPEEYEQITGDPYVA